MTSTPTTDVRLASRHRGWLFAALGMLVVSTDSIFIRWADTDTWTLVCLVGVFSAAVLAVYARAVTGVGPRTALAGQWCPALTVAALTTGSLVFFTLAINNTTIANVVAIIASVPAVTAYIAWLVLGERTLTVIKVAMAVAIGGVVLIVAGSLGAPSITGDLYAFAAAVSFSGSVTVWRKYPAMGRPYVLALGSVMLIAVSLPQAQLDGVPRRVWMAAALMGGVFNVAGRILYATASRYAPAGEVGLFAPVETVAAIIWAWIFFAEPPSGRAVLGAVIIIVAIFCGTVIANRSVTNVPTGYS